MLRSIKDLKNYRIQATDGDIGHIDDFYFDDDAWVVRYLVVEAGSWLSSRKVLLSPISLQQPDLIERTLPVSITMAQVKGSPDIDTDLPVSRQNEESFLGYYDYPSYWNGAGIWGDDIYPYAMAPGFAGYGVERIGRQEREREIEAHLDAERARHRNDDPHLRSCKAVDGYHIRATDGEIGHVCGYLVDDETWAIRYVIVDTSNWWLGHQILVAPPWITDVDWVGRTVSVDLSRTSIKASPAYDAELEWSRELDLSLYQHYGRPGFWAGGARLDDKAA